MKPVEILIRATWLSLLWFSFKTVAETNHLELSYFESVEEVAKEFKESGSISLSQSAELRSALARDYAQAWLRAFGTAWLKKSEMGSAIQRTQDKLQEHLQGEKLVLSSPTNDPKKDKAPFTLSYQVSIANQRAIIEARNDGWTFGFELELSGKARNYLRWDLPFEIRSEADCRWSESLCTFSAQKRLHKYVTAQLHSWTKFEPSQPIKGFAAVEVVYQGPIPFLEL